MFGLSGEHLLILAGILLIFGPRKLPELGSSFGKALRNFKEGLNGPVSSGKIEVKAAPEQVIAKPAEVTTPDNTKANAPTTSA